MPTSTPKKKAWGLLQSTLLTLLFVTVVALVLTEVSKLLNSQIESAKTKDSATQTDSINTSIKTWLEQLVNTQELLLDSTDTIDYHLTTPVLTVLNPERLDSFRLLYYTTSQTTYEMKEKMLADIAYALGNSDSADRFYLKANDAMDSTTAMTKRIRTFKPYEGVKGYVVDSVGFIKAGTATIKDVKLLMNEKFEVVGDLGYSLSLDK